MNRILNAEESISFVHNMNKEKYSIDKANVVFVFAVYIEFLFGPSHDSISSQNWGTRLHALQLINIFGTIILFESIQIVVVEVSKNF